jgi:hypothetical protein
VFTARYALNPYIKQIRFVFKGLMEQPLVPNEQGIECFPEPVLAVTMVLRIKPRFLGRQTPGSVIVTDMPAQRPF